MNSEIVYSQTATSWEMVFIHLGKTLQHLKSALLMSLAAAATGFAWFCCWLDRFLSGKRAGSWIISPRRAEQSIPELQYAEPLRPTAVAEKMPPLSFERNHGRTIDSLIREKDSRPRIYENGNASSKR
jgi:hypothetical protein